MTCKRCYWKPLFSKWMNGKIKEIWCPVDQVWIDRLPKECSHFVEQNAKVRRKYEESKER